MSIFNKAAPQLAALSKKNSLLIYYSIVIGTYLYTNDTYFVISMLLSTKTPHRGCSKIFCPSICCVFDILLFDILQYNILLIRYFACSIFCDSIFCDFDILRFRYFATSIFCLSISCVRYFAIRYFAFRYFVRNPFNPPPPPVRRGLKSYSNVDENHITRMI